MKKCAWTVLIVFFSFIACGKDGGPTTPLLPNAFKITDFQYQIVTGHTLWGSVTGTYTNNTSSEATITGTVKWGDGKSNTFRSNATIPKGPNASGQWQAGALDDGSIFGHVYAAKGTYSVEITATATFSNGAISDTWKNDINVNK